MYDINSIISNTIQIIHFLCWCLSSKHRCVCQDQTMDLHKKTRRLSKCTDQWDYYLILLRVIDLTLNEWIEKWRVNFSSVSIGHLRHCMSRSLLTKQQKNVNFSIPRNWGRPVSELVPVLVGNGPCLNLLELSIPATASFA